MSQAGFKTYQVVFDLIIEPHQIPEFKREILVLTKPWENIWHNHAHENDDQSLIKGGKILYGKNIQRYPLIHFRTEKLRLDERTCYAACIWGINEGAEALKKFCEEEAYKNFQWRQKKRRIQVIGGIFQPKMRKHPALELLPKFALEEFSLMRILPFDKASYRLYKNTEFFSDKLRLLEDQIKNQVILFGKAFQQDKIGEEGVVLRILDLSKFETCKYYPHPDKDQANEYLGVDLLIGTNAVLPDGIGLGKHKALGYGVLRKKRDRRSLKD